MDSEPVIEKATLLKNTLISHAITMKSSSVVFISHIYILQISPFSCVNCEIKKLSGVISYLIDRVYAETGCSLNVLMQKLQDRDKISKIRTMSHFVCISTATPQQE